MNDCNDLEEITTTIILNEMRKKSSVDEIRAEAEGLVSLEKTNGKGFCGSHQDFEYYYCHKKEHIKINYPKLKEKK